MTRTTTDNGVEPIALATESQEPLPMTTTTNETTETTNEPPPAVEELLGDMERRFGEGALMRLGDTGARPDRRRHPHRRALARCRARHRRTTARPDRRDLRT